MIRLSEILGGGFILEKKKGVLDDDEIVIPNVGKMLFRQLKKSVEVKAKDLYDRIKKGEYDRISDSMLETFSHLTRVARSYSVGEKVPQSTLFKESIQPINEFQQRYKKTNIVITGIPKGNAKRIFIDLTKVVENLPDQPNELRIDF